MKKITADLLHKYNACAEGYRWVEENKLIGLSIDKFIDGLIESDKFSWANWLMVRVLNHKQKISYAVFAAEQVLEIYEKKYQGDNRPRNAINAAKKCIKYNTQKNRAATATAAAAAAAAAYAAATATATYAAAAAYAAAAYAAAAATATATYAAYAAATATATYVAAKKEMQAKILAYGLKLLR